MRIARHIPNAITCLNLTSGAVAIVADLYLHRPDLAVWCIIAAAVFDFFDGFAARLLKSYSEIGADLDSLADVVSFGLAPAIHLFTIMTTTGDGLGGSSGVWWLIPLVFIPCFAALRLAKFNNDKRGSTDFFGLPVPSNAFFWLGWAAAYPTILSNFGVSLSFALTYVFIIVMCGAMVSDIPMLSMKIKSLSFNKNKSRYLLIAVFVIAIASCGIAGFAIGVAYYLLSSIVISKRWASAA